MSELDPTERERTKASLRTVWRPVALSTALSFAAGFSESLTFAGLASYLASGVLDGSSKVFGTEALGRPPVIGLLALVSFLLNVFNAFVRERAVARWEVGRRRDLLAAFRAAEYSAQTDESGAALTVTLEQTTRAAMVIGFLIGLINGIVGTAVMVGLAFVASWQISLVTIVAGGLLILGMRRLSRRTRVMSRSIGAEAVAVGEYVGDMVSSVREIQLLDRWNDVERWTNTRLDRVYRLTVRSRFFAGLVGPVFSIGTVAVGLAVGFVATRGSGPSVPGLAASGLLLIRSLSLAQSSQVSYQALHDGLPFMDRVLARIERLREQARSEGSSEPPTKAHLEVRSVSTSYGNETVLHGIDLEFQGPGGIAIVGPSGGGKSTLLLTLSGLVTPQEGSVLLDGRDVRSIDRSTVGSAIGYLAQDPRLVREPLRDNLTRSDVDASDAELLAALASVGLERTVDGFGQGLDSPMGRGGEGFSGGELQRLGLARLLVNEPLIWLLDEPTSALDRQNSERVADLVAAAVRDHLVILVTHRSDLLAHCGHLVYVEDGAVVDQGAPSVVAARHPFVQAMLDGLGDEAAADTSGAADPS